MPQRRDEGLTGKLPLTAYQRHRLLQVLRKTPDAKLYRRLLAIAEMDRGTSVTQIAELLRVGRASLYNWLRRFLESHDPYGVADRPGRGRKSLFSPEVQDLLDQTLAVPPLEWGYRAAGWTLPLLRDHLYSLTGRSMSIFTLERHLQKERYAFKRPRYRLKPDPEYRKKSAVS